MGKLDLEKEIIIGQKNAKNIKELYELLSSYNAYSILFLKAKEEYEQKKYNIKQYYSDSNCYKESINDLFSQFKSDEFLKVKSISNMTRDDKLFLVDDNTLLRIHSFDIMNSNIGGLSHINYEFLNINNCKGKIYKESVYCGDPLYCDKHFEDKEVFGLFEKDKLITPTYALDSRLNAYNNLNIREILKVQTLDEIYEKINIAKNEKVGKLILSKKINF